MRSCRTTRNQAPTSPAAVVFCKCLAGAFTFVQGEPPNAGYNIVFPFDKLVVSTKTASYM